jgi:hypothetical protein
MREDWEDEWKRAYPKSWRLVESRKWQSWQVLVQRNPACRGINISVIAIWRGHEIPITTHQYVEAGLAMKEGALARLHEPAAKIQCHTAPDSLFAFLKRL